MATTHVLQYCPGSSAPNSSSSSNAMACSAHRLSQRSCFCCLESPSAAHRSRSISSCTMSISSPRYAPRSMTICGHLQSCKIDTWMPQRLLSAGGVSPAGRRDAFQMVAVASEETLHLDLVQQCGLGADT